VKDIRQPDRPLPGERLGALEVKVARSAQDWRRAKAALGREHGLGAGREAGDRLCQLVLEDGKLVAVLVWCAAAWHLQARDQTVGWDAVTRSKRLKLVVQLRRFLVLEATRRPNLASQCLGAGLRELVGQWESRHGCRPLLAESFSDPESHAGTVYKATNWTQAGLTKGYTQDHTDFYVPNGRPKKLWLKELAPPRLRVDVRARAARRLPGRPRRRRRGALVRSQSASWPACGKPFGKCPIPAAPPAAATRSRPCSG